MTEPCSIGTARNQLRDAIAEFQAPTCDPLTVTPWIAMSALQKAIRRGQDGLAQRAAATLLSTSPERLWRRCGCIAFEDIGVADLDTVAIVTAALAGKKIRASLGGEWRVASFIVSKMVQHRNVALRTICSWAQSFIPPMSGRGSISPVGPPPT